MQKKDIATQVILTIVTCGIYGIVWFVQLTNDVAKASKDEEFTGGKSLALTLVTCGIYSFFWAYRLGKDITIIKKKYLGFEGDDSAIYLILQIFGLGIVNYCLAQSELNNLIDAKKHKKSAS